jgi:hypothetical protein
LSYKKRCEEEEDLGEGQRNNDCIVRCIADTKQREKKKQKEKKQNEGTRNWRKTKKKKKNFRQMIRGQ